MTKNELAIALAEKTGLSKQQSMQAIEGVVEIMTDTFSKGESVSLRRFGTFKVLLRKEHTGRDINRNTFVKIPQRRAVKFVESRNLKGLVK